MPSHAIVDIERGPKQVGAQTVIDAPASELFAILANPHRHHEADGSGWVRPDVIGPRELQRGDRFRVAMKFAGRLPYSITNRVVDLDHDRAIEWGHFGNHTWRWEFEPVDDASTTVTEIFDYRRSPVPAGLERSGMVKNNQKSIRASLLQLQERFSTTD